eukprot:1162003-Pelagomonas_calceolata.AAC.3
MRTLSSCVLQQLPISRCSRVILGRVVQAATESRLTEAGQHVPSHGQGSQGAGAVRRAGEASAVV